MNDDTEELPPLKPAVPTIDDEEPPVVEYPDWDEKTTKIVSGPIGPAAKYPGVRFVSRKAAHEYWTKRAGRIFQDIRVTRNRYIYRVRRDA